jgi:predicted transcriptional regulator
LTPIYILNKEGIVKNKEIKIEVKRDENAVDEFIADEKLINFYKKETGKIRVTKKGLNKFVNNLFRYHVD